MRNGVVDGIEDLKTYRAPVPHSLFSGVTLSVNNAMRYHLYMIKSFRCPDTHALFSGRRVARFANLERVALRKLQQVHAAASLDFLRVPQPNRLEALKGKRKGQYSIRINDQWRVCFRFEGGHAFDVEIVDYH